TIVKELAAKTGLPLGNVLDKVKTFPEGQSQVSNGFSVQGRSYKHLESLLDTYGYMLSVQNGQLSVLQQAQPGKPLDYLSGSVIAVSQTSGMVGSPEIAEKGTDKKQVTKVKSLLQPRFVPGGTIRLDSASLKGFYRIERVTHHGDLFETPFYSELKIKAVQS